MGNLDSLVNMDVRLARKVLKSDDAVDAINRDMFIKIQGEIKNNIKQMESLIHLHSASRHLECRSRSRHQHRGRRDLYDQGRNHPPQNRKLQTIDFREVIKVANQISSA